MSKREVSVSIPEVLNKQLLDHLIREDGQEDLAFALWQPSFGAKRMNVLIKELVFPKEGDRQVHGNVSYNPEYFKRVCEEAMQKRLGVCFMHSHPYPGWQYMSDDDIAAEKKMAPTVDTLTGLPLIGLTVGSDGTWSARSWEELKSGKYERRWAQCVKSVGEALKTDFADIIVPEPEFKEMFKRTATVYGKKNHNNLSRLRVGIVGLGSVGSFVAESLARMGVERFVLIDYDKVEEHNLDRLLGATAQDLGHHKVYVAQRQIRASSTANSVEIDSISESISAKEGYAAALDCDVIFSCVDKPRARYILNHIAYAHLIPVVDGGIKVRFEDDEFSGADWQIQTVSPGKPCLQCLNTYNTTDVSMEIEGLLEDPTYLEGAGKLDEKANENIFPFSAHLASMEIFQFIGLTTGLGDISDFGVQRYRYDPGHVSRYLDKKCSEHCSFKDSVATGDSQLRVYDV